ncbi:MAG: 4Fe-4S binding protein, partial [Thermoplasmata archaeon]|nr:4Fe-4S binding protein [Thermoplasmata archaeon]
LRDFYVTSAAEKRTPEEAGEIRLDFAEGLTPCAEGLTMEGMFSTALDIDRVGNTMNIVGAVERDEEIRTCKSDGILIFEEGAVVIRGRDEDELGTKRETLKRLVRKSLFCVGCGVCLGLCDEDAIRLKNGRSRIDEEKCIHCGKCISPCPAADFTGEFRF